MSTSAIPPRALQWWTLRSQTEQRFLLGAGIAIAALLLWLLLWEPLLRDTARLQRALPAQRAMLDEAKRQVDAIAGLARATVAAPTHDPAAGINAALAARGLKLPASAIERLDSQRWRLTIDSIAFDALASLLESLQRDTGLRAIEFSAVERVEPGQVRAEFTLGR